jgi:uncharacterized protein (TIGR00251 family)
MKISIRVKPNSRENKIEKIGEGAFLVRVSAPAKEGKANKAVIELLSEYFNVPKSNVAIKSGHKNKIKLINIC